MRKVFLLLCCLFCVLTSFAQTSGCLVALENRVYYETPYQTQFFRGGGSYSNSSVCTPGNRTSQYYNILTSSSTTCYAVYTGPSNDVQFVRPMRYSKTGTLVTFSILTCPLDDYDVILLLICALLGMGFLRQSVLYQRIQF